MGYYLGARKILALREKAKEQLGEKFRLQDFHKALLEMGHTTLKGYEILTENYITEKLQEAKK